MHGRVVKVVTSLITKKTTLILLVVGCFLFFVLNLVIYLYFADKTLPQTFVAGRNVGSSSISELESIDLIPETVTLRSSHKEQKVNLNDLEVKVDWRATDLQLRKERTWLPLVNFFKVVRAEPVIIYSESQIDSMISSIVKDFAVKSKDAKLEKKNSSVTLVPSKKGYSVNEEALKRAILDAIKNRQEMVDISLQDVAPKVSDVQITQLIEKVERKQEVSISYVHEDKQATLTPSDILSWYVIKPNSFTLSKERIQNYIKALGASWGITVENADEITANSVAALDKEQDYSGILKAAPKVATTYTYCVAGKGVNSTYLPGFAAKLNATLNDARGWSLGGKVRFVEVSSNCSFTAWLASGSEVAAFSPACDSIWSCSVGSNVIINFTRWQNASPAWNAAGGSLDNYRSMVINHETGHWLGFGHRFCSGSGQLAPVMQQQSMGLQGCKFNPWPLESEKADL